MSTSSIFGATGDSARRYAAKKPLPRMAPRRRGGALPGDPVAPADAASHPTAGHRRPPENPSTEAREAPRHKRWIGVDFAGWVEWAAAPSSRTWLPLVALALAFALGIAALRIDLIRTRYALAEVVAEEEALLAEQRELIARKRQLRSPTVLARLARERGFRPVVAVSVLADPMPRDPADTSILPEAPSLANTALLPDVAAPPPGDLATAASANTAPAVRP